MFFDQEMLQKNAENSSKRAKEIREQLERQRQEKAKEADPNMDTIRDMRCARSFLIKPQDQLSLSDQQICLDHIFQIRIKDQKLIKCRVNSEHDQYLARQHPY